jgi:hypothetical protein
MEENDPEEGDGVTVRFLRRKPVFVAGRVLDSVVMEKVRLRGVRARATGKPRSTA